MLNLTNELPSVLSVNSKNLKIKTDFRTWLKFQQDMKNITSNIELISVVKSVFLDDDVKLMPYEFQATLDAIAEFIANSKGYINNIQIGKSVDNTIPYDYDLDANYIYGAFLQQFNIDLFEIELHFYKFVALFECLDESTTFKKIVGYRATDTRKIKDKNQRSQAEKMKKMFEIVDEKQLIDFEQEKAKMLAEWG